MKQKYHFNHKNDGHIKLGIMNLAQQNLYMLKRLTEKKSEYSVKKMEEDYKKFQNYKKIMCNFPCINFNKEKRGFSCDNKNFRNIQKDFLPTINYINDGYIEKLKKRIKEQQKKEENNLDKNKYNDKAENNNLMNNELDYKIKDKKKLKDDFEYEFYNEKEKGKLINISRNEAQEKEENQ